MTNERFLALLDAYGADIGRWPVAERAAARALAAAAPAELQHRLADAAALDGWLDAAGVAPPAAALVERAVGAAVPARQRFAAGFRRWLWPGVGIAGIVAAGSIAGVVAASAVLGPAPAGADWPERSTAFGDPPAEPRDE